MNNKVDFIIRIHKELDERARVLESQEAHENEWVKLSKDRQWILNDTDRYLCRITPMGKTELFEALLQAFGKLN
mgnify:CR=1 FL=1|tara:strand:+ start:196 stop:417 length:222 start_codon:yes stop_codon:yes gene_type:complete